MKAKQNATIAVTVYFWTNDIADDPDHVLCKHAWDTGTVRVQANGLHDIAPGRTIAFNHPDNLGEAVQRALAEAGVTLHKSNKYQRKAA